MNDRTFLQLQVVQLRQLLEDAKHDPILAPQLKERLEAAEAELQELEQQVGGLFPPEKPVLPRAAIFLKGGGVEGTEGIRPGLAGESLIQYEKMYIEQALHDEREAARASGRKRRRRGAPTPALLFTGTPRGSFGLEFVPKDEDDGAMLEIHGNSLRNLAKDLVLVGGSEDTTIDEVVKQIPPRVLGPMKQFLKTLANYNAELRLAFPDAPSKTLNVDSVKRAAERLEREVEEKEIELPGIFRGVTLDTGDFNFQPDDGELIAGTVNDEFTEEDMQSVLSLTGIHGIATILKTTVRQVNSIAAPTYVLLKAQEMA